MLPTYKQLCLRDGTECNSSRSGSSICCGRLHLVNQAIVCAGSFGNQQFNFRRAAVRIAAATWVAATPCHTGVEGDAPRFAAQGLQPRLATHVLQPFFAAQGLQPRKQA